MEAIADWFKWLNDAHRINLSIFYDAFDRGKFLGGLLTTLKLSAICLVTSVAIGVVGAWLQGSRFTFARRIMQGYIQFFRNTPPLVQLYFFYFAIGNLLPRVTDAYGQAVPPVSNFAWAIVSFSFFAGAFNVEIFRAGVEAVPRATVEAAEALGYSRLKAYIHVVLPLAFRISLPALNNNLVNLIKTTTLAYAIGVPELLYVSAQIWSDVLNVREMMNVLLVAYVAIVGVLVMAMNRWERAMRMPGYSV
ncbi:MAG: amino acid ABC transporter permease [Proteobacteria bacterium]|nr:amino acid ABC transporter permease [Pseudomonadota bacterium]